MLHSLHQCITSMFTCAQLCAARWWCRSVEMFFAALLHRAAFSHHDYEEQDSSVAASERMSLISNVMDSLNPNDVMSDVKGVVSTQKAKVGLDHLLMSSWEEVAAVQTGGQSRRSS
jgi:hypothetical protein